MGPNSRSPECPGRYCGTFGHRLELGPDDLFMTDARTDAAVRACLDVFAPDHPGIVDEALRNQLRMLDEVGCVGDDARHEHLTLRQLDLLPDVVLMLVPNVGSFDRILHSVDLEHQIGNVFDLDV